MKKTPPDIARTPDGGLVARPMPRPGAIDFIAGETASFKSNLLPYLPSELIGGSIPYVPGMEDEGVWNAASQACATERVHFCYTVFEGRCWYLACPSAALSSNPDSWCPLAASLPGNSEYWDRKTVYMYEQEGQAAALRWDPETGRLQIFVGAARTLLPRLQTMDANFVTINASIATIVPWRNRALRTEQLSRGAANMLLYGALMVIALSICLLTLQFLATNFVKRDLASVKAQSDQAAAKLLVDASNALQSESIKHMVRIQQLLDALTKINGTLVIYNVEKNTVDWEALVPPSFSSCSGALGSCQILPGMEKDGRVRIKGTR